MKKGFISTTYLVVLALIILAVSILLLTALRGGIRKVLGETIAILFKL